MSAAVGRSSRSETETGHSELLALRQRRHRCPQQVQRDREALACRKRVRRRERLDPERGNGVQEEGRDLQRTRLPDRLHRSNRVLAGYRTYHSKG